MLIRMLVLIKVCIAYTRYRGKLDVEGRNGSDVSYRIGETRYPTITAQELLHLRGINCVHWQWVITFARAMRHNYNYLTLR